MDTYELHLAVQENPGSELGQFQKHAEKDFPDAERARMIFESQDVGFLLCSYDSDLREYTGKFAVAFRIVLDGVVVSEGQKNQMQYAAECVYE